MLNRRSLATCLLTAAAITGCDMNGKPKPLNWRHDDEPVTQKDVKPEPVPKILPMTHFASGQMLERQGDLPAAIEQYEKAIAANPRFATAYNRLGIVYQNLGRLEDALKAFQNGIRAVPDAAFLRNNLGWCFAIQNHLKEAEQQYRAALSIKPEFQRARMNLAALLAATGRADESALEFSRVVSRDTAYYNVGVIRLDRRDYVMAMQMFRRALDLNPRHIAAAEGLRQATALAEGRSPGAADSPDEADAGDNKSVANAPPRRPTLKLAGDAREEATNR